MGETETKTRRAARAGKCAATAALTLAQPPDAAVAAADDDRAPRRPARNGAGANARGSFFCDKRRQFCVNAADGHQPYRSPVSFCLRNRPRSGVSRRAWSQTLGAFISRNGLGVYSPGIGLRSLPNPPSLPTVRSRPSPRATHLLFHCSFASPETLLSHHLCVPAVLATFLG